MQVSRFTRTLLIFAAAAPLVAVEPAMAQFLPHSRGGQGWGPYVSPGSSYVDRGVVAQQKGADRRQQLALNAQQHQVQNQLLQSQAQQNSAWISQRQSSVDQIRWEQAVRQGQQFAQRAPQPSVMPSGGVVQPLPAALPAALPQTPPLETTPPAVDGEEPSGEVKWPTLLKDPRFAEPRSKLEKLLAADRATEAGLTSAEYEEMVRAATRMKDVLRGMAGELIAAEYLAVEGFLNDLISKYQAKANPTN